MAVPTPTTPAEAQALALWKAAEADFADEKRHTAFIEWCAQTGLLPLAARLYAAREEASPGDPAVARCRELIVAKAVATLGVPARPAGSIGFFVRHKQAILIALGVATLALGVLLIGRLVMIFGAIGEAAR